MESYRKHRRLAAQIGELADSLRRESQSFHLSAARRRHPRHVAESVDQSAEWLQHGFRALLMAVVSLRDAESQLSGP